VVLQFTCSIALISGTIVVTADPVGLNSREVMTLTVGHYRSVGRALCGLKHDVLETGVVTSLTNR